MVNDALLSRYLNPLFPIPTSAVMRNNLEHAVKCVLFDIYGTLFISGSGDIGAARHSRKETLELKNLLVENHVRKEPDEILRAFFETIEKHHNLQKKKGIDYPEVEIDRVWMEVLGSKDRAAVRDFAIRFELIANPVYPMPNLKATLSAFRKNGTPMGIISNAQFFTPYLFSLFLQADMDQLGFDPGLVFFSYQWGYAKPSLFLHRKALEKIRTDGLAPDSLLVVGNDMLNDILPASRIGFSTGLFAGDARSLRMRNDDPRCKNLIPDLVITDLIQLKKIVLGGQA